VSDIFHEVDEELRREQLKKLWDQYGTLALTLALLIVISVAGWRAYQWWEARKAAEVGGQFEAAMLLSERGKHQEAEQAFAKIAAEGTAGYRSLAQLRAAEEIASSDPQGAVKAYDKLASDSSAGQVLQDLAAVRAGMILVDTAPYEEMRGRLDALTAEDRPFHDSARELLAVAAWRGGDQAATRRWVDMILADRQTPPGIRRRAEMLMALTAGVAKG
jgi:hypothetical protein